MLGEAGGGRRCAAKIWHPHRAPTASQPIQPYHFTVTGAAAYRQAIGHCGRTRFAAQIRIIRTTRTRVARDSLFGHSLRRGTPADPQRPL